MLAGARNDLRRASAFDLYLSILHKLGVETKSFAALLQALEQGLPETFLQVVSRARLANTALFHFQIRILHASKYETLSFPPSH